MTPVLARLEATEQRQLEDRSRQIADQAQNEARFSEIFDAMQDKTFPPQKVFYDGQVYDAKAFATNGFSRLRLSAKVWYTTRREERRIEDEEISGC